jgi:hypothetical protein
MFGRGNSFLFFKLCKIYFEDSDGSDIVEFGDAAYCRLALDATECLVRKPSIWEINQFMYSGKQQDTTMKYESNLVFLLFV